MEPQQSFLTMRKDTVNTVKIAEQKDKRVGIFLNIVV